MNDEIDPRLLEATEAATGLFRLALLHNNPNEAAAAWRSGREAIRDACWHGLEWEEVPLSDLVDPRHANLIEEKRGALLVGEVADLTFEEWITWPNTGGRGWASFLEALRAGRERFQQLKKEA